MDNITEDQCSVCSTWPAAERAERRREYVASDDYVRMPMKGVCDQCQLAFWGNIIVWVDSQEELKALNKAIRQERRRGSLRPAELLLREISSKAANHWVSFTREVMGRISRAADLKFLHHLRQIQSGTSNRKRH